MCVCNRKKEIWKAERACVCVTCNREKRKRYGKKRANELKAGDRVDKKVDNTASKRLTVLYQFNACTTASVLFYWSGSTTSCTTAVFRVTVSELFCMTVTMCHSYRLGATSSIEGAAPYS